MLYYLLGKGAEFDGKDAYDGSIMDYAYMLGHVEHPFLRERDTMMIDVYNKDTVLILFLRLIS